MNVRTGVESLVLLNVGSSVDFDLNDPFASCRSSLVPAPATKQNTRACLGCFCFDGNRRMTFQAERCMRGPDTLSQVNGSRDPLPGTTKQSVQSARMQGFSILRIPKSRKYKIR